MTEIYYYYETDANGDEIYRKNSEGDEYYVTTPVPQDIFAKTRDGRLKYAVDHSGNEIYPKHPLVKNEFMITFAPYKAYAKDASGRERYPKTLLGDENFLLDDTYKPIYARNENLESYYPKNKEGDEFMAADTFIQNEDGTIVYPLNKFGLPIYEKKDNVELYHVDEKGLLSIGKDITGNQVYAKNELGDEYYPPNNQFAYTLDNVPIYAKNSLGEVIYPKTAEGDEYYISNVKTNSVLLANRYAKDKEGNEIYPEGLIIGRKYARNNLDEVEYPLDVYGNEWTLRPSTLPLDESVIFPNGYPITNDGWVIVPKINNEPYLSNTMHPQVQDENVVGLLFRNAEVYDYLTNVRSSRKSKSAFIEYSKLPRVKVPNPQAPLFNIKLAESINWATGLLLTTLVIAAFGIYLKFRSNN